MAPKKGTGGKDDGDAPKQVTKKSGPVKKGGLQKSVSGKSASGGSSIKGGDVKGSGPKDVPKKVVPQKAPAQPAKKTAAQKAAQKKRENERKNRKFERMGRKKKRDDHLTKGLLTAEQRDDARDITEGVNAIDELLRNDPELYGKLQEEIAPYFNILRKLANANPRTYQSVARNLYKDNYVAKGDTDVSEDDSDDDETHLPPPVPGRRRTGKVPDSTDEDDEQIEEPKKPKMGSKRKGKKPVEEDELPAESGNAPGSKRKESSSADDSVDGSEGSPSKRLRSKSPPVTEEKEEGQPRKSVQELTKAALSKTNIEKVSGAARAKSKDGSSVPKTAGTTKAAGTTTSSKQSSTRSTRSNTRATGANADPVSSRTRSTTPQSDDDKPTRGKSSRKPKK